MNKLITLLIGAAIVAAANYAIYLKHRPTAFGLKILDTHAITNINKNYSAAPIATNILITNNHTITTYFFQPPLADVVTSYVIGIQEETNKIALTTFTTTNKIFYDYSGQLQERALLEKIRKYDAISTNE